MASPSNTSALKTAGGSGSPYSPQELQELFALFDKKQHGRVAREDVTLMLRSLGVNISDRKGEEIGDSLSGPMIGFGEFEGVVHRKDVLALRMGNMKRAVSRRSRSD